MAQPATDRDRTKPHRPQKDDGAATDRPADPPEEAAEAVMGLDMVLVDAARGPLRRLVPPAGTALRFGSALARQPGTVARRAGELARELGRIAAGSSELAPGKKDKRFADPAWTGNGLLRRAMQAAPGHRAHRLGADRGRRPRLAGRRADPVHRDEPRRRPGPQQRAGAQPAVAEGGHRHRRAERRPRAAADGVATWRRPPRVPSMVEPGRLHRRRGPRRHPGRRRLPHRRLRADPVRADDGDRPRGAAADGAADDQQVLHRRPRARAAASSSTTWPPASRSS